MTQRDPWAPNIFPPGEEPDWVVGYEITASGWQPIDAARDAEMMQEALDSIEAGEGIPHAQVMAELRALRETLLAASPK